MDLCSLNFGQESNHLRGTTVIKGGKYKAVETSFLVSRIIWIALTGDTG